MKKFCFILCFICLLFCMTGCMETSNDDNTDKTPVEPIEEIDESHTDPNIFVDELVFDEDDYYSDWQSVAYYEINLNNELTTTSASSGVEISPDKITITKAGIYVLNGSFSGSIIINSSKSLVRLVLNNATIKSKTGSALIVFKAAKAIISVAPDTKNYLEDSSIYNYTDSDYAKVDTTIYSKEDLIINGSGDLTVIANYNDAIKGNDVLKIGEVKLTIQSVDDGICANDGLIFDSGEYIINTNGDGIKCTNDDDATLGYVIIQNGTFTIKCANDGIQSSSLLSIYNGVFNITTSKGASYAVASGVSAKGLKSRVGIEIYDGIFTISSSDDSIHSNDYITIKGGTFTLASGDDGVHSDTKLIITDCNMTITKSYEGLESQEIQISGGTINLKASDDGINAAGGADSSSIGRPGQQGGFTANANNRIVITGGTIIVNADGDGVDSNGHIYVSGGLLFICGPTSSGDGALDFDGEMIVTGGTIIAVGSTGMAETPSTTSTQYCFQYNLTSTKPSGTLISIFDSSGKLVLAFIPNKTFQSIVVSSPLLEKNAKYSLYTGGTIVGEANNNYYTIGTVSGNTKVVDITMSSIITKVNSGSTNPGGGGPKK